MKKKIYYWSPCLNPVGTIISTINSINSINRYSKIYEAYIINVCGEWDQHLDKFEKNSVKVKNLSFSYFKFLPKKGFVASRISYLIIFFISFIPLLILLKREKPSSIIIHLITSLPLALLNFFKFETKFILRISGYPKLNFLRRVFWSKMTNKLQLITCPTNDLLNELMSSKIFDNNKLKFLPDAILSYKDIPKLRKKDDFDLDENRKIILGVGRLTKQKNFKYLIDEFEKFVRENNDYCLYLIGDGEEKKDLEIVIKKKQLQNKVFLLGFKKNIFYYMKKSKIFVLSSLWEEVGFAMVEASINNSYLICSDCPNGPTEFLNLGKNGILFSSNKEDELYESFKKYDKLNEKKIYDDKLTLKKKALKYSKFRHFLKIEEILSSNEIVKIDLD